MPIRPLDLLDLPTLYRFRGEALSLDSTRLLTRGNPLGAMGVMSYANPRRHIYSAISSDNGATLLGGIIQTRGDIFARLLYLAPASRLKNRDVPLLIENLAAEAGSWGALHVLAELEESSDGFVPLRQAGFSVYAWQRIWNISTPLSGNENGRWQRVDSVDLPAIQNLYHQIVPPLLQPVEPVPRRAAGFMCNEGDRCYVSTVSGANGIMLFPLIHPETADVGAKLLALICRLPSRGRPVYICVRSYQAWLEPVLEDLGAKAAARQAVMVKHLVRLVKEEQTVKAVQPAGVSVQPSRVSRLERRKS